jgi:thioredoxin-related protein
MLSRRALLTGMAATAALAQPPGVALAEAVMTEDGIYRQPWFLDSFLELADDLDTTAGKGKRLAVMWELKGCPYCRDTHLINFARADIENFVKERFDVLQLNIVGDREVTDFDGEKLPEKRLAQKYGLRGTPSFQFFPERSAGLGAKPPREREVLRMQGYLEPDAFKRMFVFVADRAYERGSFSDYLSTPTLPSPASGGGIKGGGNG